MIKKINDILAGWPMTLIGGIVLIASFILPRTGHPEGENLASMGTTAVLLTGDNRKAADYFAAQVGISEVPYLKWLSNTTVKTIKAAITLSMCINFVAVTLSVLGVLTPTTGALVHNAGSCFVVLLAALLYDRKYR